VPCQAEEHHLVFLGDDAKQRQAARPDLVGHPGGDEQDLHRPTNSTTLRSSGAPLLAKYVRIPPRTSRPLPTRAVDALPRWVAATEARHTTAPPAARSRSQRSTSS